MNKKVILMILDGFGKSDKKDGNAIYLADPKFINSCLKEYPNTLLSASSTEVGLPVGQMGNSEVGHLNIGAGRVVYQALTYIDNEIKTGSFYKNDKILANIRKAKENNSNLHIMGLLSDGGVHSHISHLFALLNLCKKLEFTRVFLHLILDGRDVSPDSSLDYISELEREIKSLGVGTIASVSGRYYSMDRDKNFDRIKIAYDCYTLHLGNNTSDVKSYVTAQKKIMKENNKLVSDEFVMPSYVANTPVIADNDSIIFFNFRPDRAVQISSLFTNDKYYSELDIKRLSHINFLSFMEYGDSVVGEVAFKIDEIKNTLGEVIANHNLKQLRIAETEKYAHVTYFLDGGVNYDGASNAKLKGCDRILVDSPKVATYDLMPEMSAIKISMKLLDEIEKEVYDLIVVNYANCDMVGHTGVLDATIKAVEEVDENVSMVAKLALKHNYEVLITADHGNAEEMIDEFGTPMTKHTTFKVPFIILNKQIKLKDNGALGNIAPTILELLNIDKPSEMTLDSLIGKEE